MPTAPFERWPTPYLSCLTASGTSSSTASHGATRAAAAVGAAAKRERTVASDARKPERTTILEARAAAVARSRGKLRFAFIVLAVANERMRRK